MSTNEEGIDTEGFVARALVQIPDSRRHVVRHCGACSNRARRRRREGQAPFAGLPPGRGRS